MKEFNGVLGFTYLHMFLEKTLSCSHKQQAAGVCSVIYPCHWTTLLWPSPKLTILHLPLTVFLFWIFNLSPVATTGIQKAAHPSVKLVLWIISHTLVVWCWVVSRVYAWWWALVMTLLFTKMVVTGLWHVLANCVHNLNLYLFVFYCWVRSFNMSFISLYL